MWRNQKVSVIFPTYNEKASIKKCIEEFFATGVVDEIIVVNNNAAEGTSEEVRKKPSPKRSLNPNKGMELPSNAVFAKLVETY